MPFSLLCRVSVLLVACYLASRIMADQLFRRYGDWKIDCPRMENVGDINAIKCAAECITRANCTGFNYYQMSADWNICELCYANLSIDISISTPNSNSSAYAIAEFRLGLYSCLTNNPCSANSDQYYPHYNPQMYIQCGGSSCYEMNCSDGTLWQQDLLRCD